ncbi:PTS mannose/fructose/sorbose transporter subunit IIAB [Lactobacillus psittaci]|nr:PTS mannose/fructose/sorbose transporter subunit IIAB [Lactobacillus psittaci]
MQNLLLISHGNYAKATLESCQMILGPLKQVKAVEFKQTMNQDDLLAEIETAYASFDSAPIILVDFKGGTPGNCAIRFQAKHPEIRIYAGLSFALVLALATGTPVDEAFNQVQASSGALGSTPNLDKNTSTPSSNKKIETNNNNPAKFFVRIDERLIHGQVATMWTNALKLTRLMVVDDDIVKSNIQKTALKTACPHGIHLSILTSKGAAKRIKANNYHGQTVLILVKNPLVLQRLVENGVALPAINVGNMSTKDSSRQVAKSVAVTAEDIAAFKFLDQHGLKLYHQMVPAETAEDFMPLLDK